MDRDAVNALCVGLPGADLSDPWGGGHCCWKVGGRMFAVIGAMNPGVSLKCADEDTARALIEQGRAARAPYLPRGGWILVRWGGMEAEELAHRLRTSYATVRAGLPKRIQAGLG